MATFRTLSPALWSDPFIEGLPAQEKLLYIYLFTNEHVNNVGYMQATVRKISFETAVPQDAVEAFFAKTDKLGKTVRDGDSILCVNFVRYQTTKSPKITQNLLKVFGTVGSPKLRRCLLERYPDIFKDADAVQEPLPEGSDTLGSPPAYGIDTVSKPLPEGSDTLGKQLQDRTGYGIAKKDPEHTHLESHDYQTTDSRSGACVPPAPLNGEDIAERQDAAQAQHRRGDYEFGLIRDAYNGVKPEAPQAGYPEFLRLYNSPDWRAGMHEEILAGLDALAKGDRQFLGEERYRPGLAKFLTQEMWKMKPRAPDGQSGVKTPEEEELERRVQENERKMRQRMAERKKLLG